VRTVTVSGHQHRPRRARSPWVSAPSRPAAAPRDGHGLVGRHRAQCALVRTLQRRVPPRDRHYGYPLTITDFASRYLLTCEALSTTRDTYAFAVFERTFKDFGLPRAIAATTGCRLRRHMPAMDSVNCRSGACGSAWASSASVPGTRNRMGGTSACTRR
jgi:hypothetical protein